MVVPRLELLRVISFSEPLPSFRVKDASFVPLKSLVAVCSVLTIEALDEPSLASVPDAVTPVAAESSRMVLLAQLSVISREASFVGDERSKVVVPEVSVVPRLARVALPVTLAA